MEQPRMRGESAKTCCNRAPCTEQPRIRGERSQRKKYGKDKVGPTPHARGKAAVVVGCDELQRNNPAYAGKIRRACCQQCVRPVQPRMRGEKSWPASVLRRIAGTTPRARGKGAFLTSLKTANRSNPACAGKRTTSTTCSAKHRDQPRVRGEKQVEELLAERRDGTTPHTRGNTLVFGQVSGTGTTPHTRGKVTDGIHSQVVRPVQPRIRGEKWWAMTFIGTPSETTPHTRGNAPTTACRRRVRGFNPACAGKRLRPASF